MTDTDGEDEGESREVEEGGNSGDFGLGGEEKEVEKELDELQFYYSYFCKYY